MLRRQGKSDAKAGAELAYLLSDQSRAISAPVGLSSRDLVRLNQYRQTRLPEIDRRLGVSQRKRVAQCAQLTFDDSEALIATDVAYVAEYDLSAKQ